MGSDEISALTVGSLVKYIQDAPNATADMGLLSEIISVGDRKIYRFIWTSNPKKPTSETESSLSLTSYSLVQVAE